MKKIIILCFCISLCACVVVEFRNPQPTKGTPLIEFPEELRGLYILEVVDELEKDKDTLEISSNYYKQVSEDEKNFLSDSIVLKRYNEDYFFSYKEKKDDA